jgi:hypothetical protein
MEGAARAEADAFRPGGCMRGLGDPPHEVSRR